MHSLSQTPSIYQIRHIDSGRVYVGSTVNPQNRCRQHRDDLLAQRHCSKHLQSAWNKYGEAAFVFEILEPVLFVEDLIVREQYWIDRLRATSRRYGFNTSPIAGSSLGTKHSPEARLRMTQAQLARAPHSAETRQKMSLARRGEKNVQAKLMQEQVNIIRALYNQGHTQMMLADMFQVDRSLIGYIVRGVIWQDRDYIPRRSGPRKLFTMEQAETIRERYGTGQYTLQKLADEFETTKQTIWRIVRHLCY